MKLRNQDIISVNTVEEYTALFGCPPSIPLPFTGKAGRKPSRRKKRHPREKFLIATKMSGASDLSRENLTAMYRRSSLCLKPNRIFYKTWRNE